ncbi:hypothetical protein ACP4OV_026823 [Aristida adscensionis]
MAFRMCRSHLAALCPRCLSKPSPVHGRPPQSPRLDLAVEWAGSGRPMTDLAVEEEGRDRTAQDGSGGGWGGKGCPTTNQVADRATPGLKPQLHEVVAPLQIRCKLGLRCCPREVAIAWGCRLPALDPPPLKAALLSARSRWHLLPLPAAPHMATEG